MLRSLHNIAIDVNEQGTFQEGIKCCNMEFWRLYEDIPQLIWKPNILLAVDYVLKWVEAIALPTNDSKAIV
ncbi:hypothetical protein EPI10_018795 [Gossypium australe]|uniref:Uncharacterized protein n=1 Tax=Gossypium australe TaxID=47621 RepID=A0A5B6UCQ7_9ROSI|nr:hypothetical protein EPI10_018795 [Gossypium australe]